MNPPVLPPAQLPPSDAEHLRLLGTLGYFYAGLECLFSLFAALYMGVGAFLGLWILGMAVLSYLAAKWISLGKNWMFCMVVSCLHCSSFPIGTGLGVFSIIVLCRPTVKSWFAAKRIAAASSLQHESV